MCDAGDDLKPRPVHCLRVTFDRLRPGLVKLTRYEQHRHIEIAETIRYIEVTETAGLSGRSPA